MIAFFGLLLCVPSFGQNFGWTSAPFLLVLTLALITLTVLVVTEKKAKNPILIGSFIARKAFILPVIILFLTQGLMQANMTNTIVFVNYTLPANTAISGYTISIMYVGMSLGSILLGPLADRLEPKRILTASLLLTGIGCGIMLFFSTATTFFLLAAPFGVAVFVPMFTNEITRLSADTPMHLSTSDMAVNSIHTLAVIELACVAVGIFIVQLLPKIYKSHHIKGERS